MRRRAAELEGSTAQRGRRREEGRSRVRSSPRARCHGRRRRGRDDGGAMMPGRRRPARGSPGRWRRMRRSRPDYLHREEQHSEAEPMEPAAGSGAAGVVGGRDNGGGGRSAGRRAIRVRVWPRGERGEERGRQGMVGVLLYPPGGARSRGEAAGTATAAMATVAPTVATGKTRHLRITPRKF